jgi:hypothetical protein
VPIFNVLTTKNINKNWHLYVPFMLLDIILTKWRHPVASSEALDLLHRAMCAVMHRHIAIAIKTASKVGVFFIVICLLVAQAAAGVIRSK